MILVNEENINKSKENLKNLEKHLEYYRSIIKENKEGEVVHSSYNFESKFSLSNGLIKIDISDNGIIELTTMNVQFSDISNEDNATNFINSTMLLIEKRYEQIKEMHSSIKE